MTTGYERRPDIVLYLNVLSGNTLFDPKFKDGEQLRTYHRRRGREAEGFKDMVALKGKDDMPRRHVCSAR